MEDEVSELGYYVWGERMGDVIEIYRNRGYLTFKDVANGFVVRNPDLVCTYDDQTNLGHTLTKVDRIVQVTHKGVTHTGIYVKEDQEQVKIKLNNGKMMWTKYDSLTFDEDYNDARITGVPREKFNVTYSTDGISWEPSLEVVIKEDDAEFTLFANVNVRNWDMVEANLILVNVAEQGNMERLYRSPSRSQSAMSSAPRPVAMSEEPISSDRRVYDIGFRMLEKKTKIVLESKVCDGEKDYLILDVMDVTTSGSKQAMRSIGLESPFYIVPTHYDVVLKEEIHSMDADIVSQRMIRGSGNTRKYQQGEIMLLDIVKSETTRCDCIVVSVIESMDENENARIRVTGNVKLYGKIGTRVAFRVQRQYNMSDIVPTPNFDFTTADTISWLSGIKDKDSEFAYSYILTKAKGDYM